MNDYINQMTGGILIGVLMAAFTFAFLGNVLGFIMDIQTRDKEGERLPYKFSLKVFVLDNVLRVLRSLISSIITVFICIRFSESLFGIPLTMFFAFGVGFCFDAISLYIKKKRKEGIGVFK